MREIERSSGAFQRELNRRKVRQIRDFFRNETDQPVVPGAVLLFTSEELEFSPIGQYEQMGDLALPRAPFLIIDGQHRLAGLHFYLREPDADRRVEVPCVIFDGKAAEFATEMFVIINSTHTRINKSHIVDLYEKIEWGTDPHKKLAARLVRALYDESDSPLRYHVNMLGGRSQRDMWINQAQLFGEVHRFVTRRDAEAWTTDGRGLSRDRAYGFLRDVLRAAKRVFGDAWGDNKRYMVTRDVTLKALIRVAGDVAAKSRALGLSPAASARRYRGVARQAIRALDAARRRVPARRFLRALSGARSGRARREDSRPPTARQRFMRSRRQKLGQGRHAHAVACASAFSSRATVPSTSPSLSSPKSPIRNAR